MKIKFINKETKAEIPYVTIGNFIYLLSEDKIQVDEYYVDDINTIRKSVMEYDEDYWFARQDYKKVIFTNDLSLTDVPQIQLETDNLKLRKTVAAQNYALKNFGKTPCLTKMKLAWEDGFDTCSKTYSYSAKDMEDFAFFCCDLADEENPINEELHLLSIPELLVRWEEQRIKTIEI